VRSKVRTTPEFLAALDRQLGSKRRDAGELRVVPSCGGTTQLGLLVLVHAGAMVVSADRRGRRRVVIAKARMIRATTRAMLLASSQADKDV